MKKMSCGLLLVINSPEGKRILLAHVTNQVQYDIPKGCVEEGETPIDTVLRELYEETNIDYIDKDDINGFLDLGIFDYLPNKDLHLFLYECDDEDIPDIEEMDCNSTFVDRFSRVLPEVDDFKYILLTEMSKYTSKTLFPVLTKALSRYFTL